MAVAFAFKIHGTVQAATTDEALAGLAAYLDPANEDHEGHEGADEPVKSLGVRWVAFEYDPEAEWFPPPGFGLDKTAQL